jgi:hypothetical protein
MNSKYHIALTRKTLQDDFDELALADVIDANLGQDQHGDIVALATTAGSGSQMRAALGHIFHTVQDFYAHANYVDLWLATQTGPSRPPAEAIDGLVPELLTHPDLRTGTFVMWRDLIYYLPLIGALARKIYVPPGSHEAMHLDSPDRGWRFRYAYAAAYQRTCAEYRRAKDAVRLEGGEAGLAELTTAT